MAAALLDLARRRETAGNAPVGAAPVETAPVGAAPVGTAPVGPAPVGMAAVPEAVTVASVGLLPGGRPTLPEVAAAVAPYGIDLTGHRSTQITAAAVAGADLVLGMERRHGREAALLVPSAWTRIFTLKEFVRRATVAGPRPVHRSVAEWLAAVGEGRVRTDLAGARPTDEVADPLGGPAAAYRATAAELAALTDDVAGLVWPGLGAGGAVVGGRPRR